MRTLILSTCIILLTSFCTKEVATCGATQDWAFIASQGMPGFQGNCYLVTNEQIRWLQLNGWVPNSSTAPNNKECPTKSQIITYLGGSPSITDSNWDALASNACPAIGFFYPAT